MRIRQLERYFFMCHLDKVATGMLFWSLNHCFRKIIVAIFLWLVFQHN